MKLVSYSKSIQKRNSNGCIVYEYHLGDKTIDGAIAKITGREPDKGFELNTRCKELCYVIKGRGKLIVGKKTTNLIQGDMVLIQPKEKYYWHGKMTLFISCSPKWEAKQHLFVKK